MHYIPEHLITESLCLEAVKQNGNALHCVPDHFKEHIKQNIVKSENSLTI